MKEITIKYLKSKGFKVYGTECHKEIHYENDLVISVKGKNPAWIYGAEYNLQITNFVIQYEHQVEALLIALFNECGEKSDSMSDIIQESDR